MYEEFELIKEGNVTQEQLDRVKTNLRAGIIRGLANNTGLASQFVSTHIASGSWKDIFYQLDRYEAVLEDVQRVAEKYLIKKIERR